MNYEILDEHMCDAAEIARAIASEQQDIWEARPGDQDDMQFEHLTKNVEEVQVVMFEALRIIANANKCYAYSRQDKNFIIGGAYDTQAVKRLFVRWRHDVWAKYVQHFPRDNTPISYLVQYVALANYWLWAKYERINLSHSQHECAIYFHTHVDDRTIVSDEFREERAA